MKSAQLHDVAASLEAKRRTATPQEGPAQRGGKELSAEQRTSQADLRDEDSSDAAGSQSGEEEDEVNEWCSSDSWSGSESDADAGSGGGSDGEAEGDDAHMPQHAAQHADRASSEVQPQSVEGFFDARAVSKPKLSLFGVAWRLLSSWVCPAAILQLHARPPPTAAFTQATLQVRPMTHLHIREHAHMRS